MVGWFCMQHPQSIGTSYSSYIHFIKNAANWIVSKSMKMSTSVNPNRVQRNGLTSIPLKNKLHFSLDKITTSKFKENTVFNKKIPSSVVGGIRHQE